MSGAGYRTKSLLSVVVCDYPSLPRTVVTRDVDRPPVCPERLIYHTVETDQQSRKWTINVTCYESRGILSRRIEPDVFINYRMSESARTTVRGGQSRYALPTNSGPQSYSILIRRRGVGLTVSLSDRVFIYLFVIFLFFNTIKQEY